MTRSNNIKGLVALIANILTAIGAIQYMGGNQILGLVLISVSAVAQALKHWADTQPNQTGDQFVQ